MSQDPHRTAAQGDGSQSRTPSGQVRADLLARMGHELRTPLNAIIGFIKLVEDGLYATEEERRDYLSSARQSALTLLDLINNILDFARLEAGHLTLERAEVDLVQMLDEVAKTLAPEAHAKEVEIDALVQAGLPRRVLSDPVRLRQVLYNLAGNAVKYTERGLVLLQVSAAEAPAGALRFSVTDTGIGVPEALHGEIFESFVQMNPHHQERAAGVGLGLSIASQIVAQMGDRIRVDSTPGEGSTFSFTVGLTPAEDKAGGEAGHSLDGRRLLVLNPDGATAPVLPAKLEARGGSATATASVTEAMERLLAADDAGTPYHAVLVDHHLRRDDALLLARKVRGSALVYQPELLHLATIGAVADVAPLGEAGYTGFLTKPVTADTLAALLAQLLERHTARGVPERPITAAPEPATAEALSRRIPEVLVAEDNAVNQKLIQALLSKQGYAVRVVDNGQEAVTAVEARPFDLVLLDVQMPVLDGIMAARAIRRTPHGRHVPMIAMTADALDGDRERCLAAGMNDHIPKPIMPDLLRTVIADWLYGGGRGRGEDGPRLLDLVHLRQVEAYAAGHDPGRFAAWVALFCAQVDDALRSARAAWEARDPAAATEPLRRMVTACGGFGAPRLQKLADSAAAVAAAEDLARLEPLLTELDQERERLCTELAEHFPAVATALAAAPGVRPS